MLSSYFQRRQQMSRFRFEMELLGYPLKDYSDHEILNLVFNNTKILSTLGIDPRYEEVVGGKLDEFIFRSKA